MIALDTNVLVRFLVVDDPDQTEQARSLLANEAAAGRPCFVGDIVLCETVWVLSRGYRVSRPEIIAILRRLLDSSQLRFKDSYQIENAVEAFERRRGDFADYLIREQAQVEKCRAVATFDRELHADPGFVPVGFSEAPRAAK
jgi:predicted nucleic-acid-binding protein